MSVLLLLIVGIVCYWWGKMNGRKATVNDVKSVARMFLGKN